MVSARLTAPESISSDGSCWLTLQRVDAGDVAANVSVVEDHPARHRLVRVHRLADLHVGVRLVAESPAGRVHIDGAGPLTARTQRRGDRPAVGDENRRQPPCFVEQIGLRAQSHRSLQHFAGVAGVGDRPLGVVGLIAAVLPPHLGVVPESAGGQQHSFARLDVQRCAVVDDARTDHSAVFDDEVVHRGVDPQRWPAVAEIDQRLEHLSDQRGAVGQNLAPTYPRRGGADEHPGRHGESLWRTVEILNRAELVGQHHVAVVLGQRRLHFVTPAAQLGGVERNALDGAADRVAALVVRVVVAPSRRSGSASRLCGSGS